MVLISSLQEGSPCCRIGHPSGHGREGEDQHINYDPNRRGPWRCLRDYFGLLDLQVQRAEIGSVSRWCRRFGRRPALGKYDITPERVLQRVSYLCDEIRTRAPGQGKRSNEAQGGVDPLRCCPFPPPCHLSSVGQSVGEVPIPRGDVLGVISGRIPSSDPRSVIVLSIRLPRALAAAAAGAVLSGSGVIFQGVLFKSPCGTLHPGCGHRRCSRCLLSDHAWPPLRLGLRLHRGHWRPLARLDPWEGGR